jgi:hypothetical protein
MDIKGPMDMMSIGRHLYFMISVDDYSGLKVAYPMQRKSDALKCYRGFAEQAWNQTCKKIKYLICDDAKEFLSSALNACLSTHGTAESSINTAMKKMRSMLKCCWTAQKPMG